MHISEGVLNLPILAGGYTLTLVGLGVGLRSMEGERIVRTAIFSSAFFVASLIHIPLGPASVHLTLNGLVGILLGWQAFCAIFVGLFLQAILFQFGGITTLGINTFNMACPALICYYLLHRGLYRGGGFAFLSGFLAGFLGVFLAAIFVACSLFISGEHFLNTAQLIVIAHAPVMFIEGIITGIIVQFIRKIKPEILG
jgi:cobalt/nickel transport system permease protein